MKSQKASMSRKLISRVAVILFTAFGFAGVSNAISPTAASACSVGGYQQVWTNTYGGNPVSFNGTASLDFCTQSMVLKGNRKSCGFWGCSWPVIVEVSNAGQQNISTYAWPSSGCQVYRSWLDYQWYSGWVLQGTSASDTSNFCA